MIKKMFFVSVTMILFMATVSWAQVRVRGYMRDSDGDGLKDTYVQPYQRTSPNKSRTDNYSYSGNYNPYSGRISPYSSSPRSLYPTNPSPYQKRGTRSYLYDD